MIELSERISARRSRRSRDLDAKRGAADVSVPDVVLPDQFFTVPSTGLPDSPEKRLMFAVLLDAITQLRQRDSTRAAEAERWVRDSEDPGLFSFENVCAVLGLEADCLAQGLLSGAVFASGRAPLRHPRTSRLRVTPRRRNHRRIVEPAAAVG